MLGVPGSATDVMRGALGVLDEALERKGDASEASDQAGENSCAGRRDLFSGVVGALGKCMTWDRSLSQVRRRMSWECAGSGGRMTHLVPTRLVYI